MKAGDRLAKSRRQEREGMWRFGGVRNPRSGARWDRKNDGRTATELVEFKRTDNQRSITLKYDDLHQLRQRAVVERRIPVLCFELAGEHFVVLPEQEYHEQIVDRRGGGSAVDLRAGATRLDEPGEVPEPVHRPSQQPVLRRPSAQWSGQRGQGGVPGDPPGPPRAVPGPRPVSRLRPRQQREVRSLGRVFRKRAPEAAKAETTATP